MILSVIGKADGPTTIFLESKIGPSWINLFGLFILVIMLLPNIIYAIKFRGIENKCKNKVINTLEQIGRYTSMFLMIFNIGLAEFGFLLPELSLVYFIGNITLLIIYLIIWVLYFKKKTFWKNITLAIIPTLIFLLSGITLRHYLLVLSAIVFGIGHLYVTYHNAK